MKLIDEDAVRTAINTRRAVALSLKRTAIAGEVRRESGAQAHALTLVLRDLGMEDEDGNATEPTAAIHIKAGEMDTEKSEALGKYVRGVWMAWASEQPSPKPSWLLPWEELSEPDKEVDRRIGVRLFLAGKQEAEAEASGYLDPNSNGVT